MSIAEKIDWWPRDDYSRVPFKLYHDEEIYEQEMERIFRGPVWNFMGLEAEIPNSGDFRTTWIGDTPVVYNRTETVRSPRSSIAVRIAARRFAASLMATLRITPASTTAGATT